MNLNPLLLLLLLKTHKKITFKNVRFFSHQSPQRTVFNKLDEKTINNRISRLCEKGRYAEALKEFDFLHNSTCFEITPKNYSHLICACSRTKHLELGRRVHDHLLSSLREPDIIVQNQIVDMYGKCGSLEDARKVFDEMPHIDVVSYTALIDGYVRIDRFGDAIKLYSEMLQSRVVQNHFTFGSILRACSGLGDVGLGKQFHAHVLKSDFGTHQTVQNALIWMYTKLGRIENAKDVFSLIVDKDLISWGSIISGFSKFGYELEALYQFREMIIEGVHKPNGIVFSSAFNACTSLQMPEYGRQIHGLCIRFGFGGDAFAGSSICDMYAKCGFLDPARIAFSQMENPDLVSWNAMIAGFANNGNANEATSLFSKMMQSGPIPDEVTVLSLLSACRAPSGVHHGMLAHSYIIKLGFNIRVTVCNALITMYSRSYNFHDAYKVFNEISDRANLVSWNSILAVCMKHNHVREVFRLFKLMFVSQIQPDHITLTTVLGSYANLASLEMVSHVHCYAIKTGLLRDVSVMNGLIDMYKKCGSLGNARTLFDSTRNPNTVKRKKMMKQRRVKKIPMLEPVEVKDRNVRGGSRVTKKTRFKKIGKRR